MKGGKGKGRKPPIEDGFDEMVGKTNALSVLAGQLRGGAARVGGTFIVRSLGWEGVGTRNRTSSFIVQVDRVRDKISGLERVQREELEGGGVREKKRDAGKKMRRYLSRGSDDCATIVVNSPSGKLMES